jgi:DNA-binding beta-propeller fold protein YncE
MYIVGSINDTVYEYNLSTAWNVTTASYLQSFSVTTQDNTPTGISFKDDGTKMYIVGGTTDTVYEYNLSTAWNVTTASYLQSFSVAAQDTGPIGISFKDDGTKMYMIGTARDSVWSYDL